MAHRRLPRHQRSVAIASLLMAASSSCGGQDSAAGGGRGTADAAAMVCTACGECSASSSIAGATHTDAPVSYTEQPPSSGDHSACWASWGAHDQELHPEQWVHNLEHGGVVLLYRCSDGCPKAVASMSAFASSHPQTLSSSYGEMPEGFAFLAWGWSLHSSCFDADAMQSFYELFVDRAPESISSDPPAQCAIP